MDPRAEPLTSGRGGGLHTGRRWLLVVPFAIAAVRTAAALPAGDLRVGASNTVQLLAALAVAAATFRRSRHATGTSRTHLVLVAAGAGAWAAGQTYWTVAQLEVPLELPFPSPADVGFLALVPLMLAAVIVGPAGRFHATTRKRQVVDGLIVGCSLLFVTWSTLLDGVLETVVGAGLLRGTLSLAYPTGDILVLSVLVVTLLTRPTAWRPSLLHYLASMGALLTADGGFVYLVANGEYATGSWVDSGWTVGLALLWLGARVVPLTAEPTSVHVQEDERWRSVVISACVGASAAAVAVHEARSEDIAEDALLYALFLGVMSALLVRSFVARKEGEAYATELAEATAAVAELQATHDLTLTAGGMATWTWLAGEGRWHLDNGRHQSPAFAALEGPSEQVLSRVEPADRSRLLAAVSASTPEAPEYEIEFGVFTDTTRARLRTRGRAHFDSEGSIVRSSGVVFDVTQRQIALHAVRRRDENLDALSAFGVRAARSTSLPALLRDAVATLGMMLRTDCEVWQIDDDSSSPVLQAAWAPPVARPSAQVATQEEDLQGEERLWPIVCSGRPWGHLWARSTEQVPITAEGESLAREVAGIVASVVDRSRANDALWREARYDALTGLPNRMRLDEELESLLAVDAPAALLYLDLVDFKAVNETYGYEIGDRLLAIVATRLEASVRPDDTVVRLGGDEFAVLLPGVEQGHALDSVLERIRTALAEPVDFGGGRVHPRASIGIATAHGTVTPGELLRNADLAMYRAKAEGSKHPVEFEDRFHRDAVERTQLADALRLALARNELVVHYQPIIDLRSGKVCGAEALVRWARPGMGLLPPIAFLDAAAALGLMEQITAVVMTEACTWAAAYVRRQPDRRFAIEVNVAPSDLASAALTPAITTALAASGLEPERLCLEVTEAAVVGDAPTVLETLRQLRALGVGMAIDDFGTGYSSLRQLKSLPIDILKVDKGFVDGLGKDLDDSTIVAAIVDMAHTLSLDAIAEGVETERQRDALRGLECEMAQGYLFGRPVPGDVALDTFPEAVALPNVERRTLQTVVVADDLEEDRWLLTRQLTRSGRYKVVGEAADGLEAVRLVHETDPDLVLLDLNMPGMNGLAALARIRAESSRTAAVLVSGYATADDTRAALLGGARGCITKGSNNVVGTLDEVLGLDKGTQEHLASPEGQALRTIERNNS